MMKNLFKAILFVISIISTQYVFAEVVNINTASADEIAENLNGIGEKKAVLIVQYREENGAFTSVEEITNVKGIGDKTLEKNREMIVIEN